jgi:hypothetical protein
LLRLRSRHALIFDAAFAGRRFNVLQQCYQWLNRPLFAALIGLKKIGREFSWHG